jgi:hypothetical protein
VLEDEHEHAVGGATDSRFMSTALSGSTTLRNARRRIR